MRKKRSRKPGRPSGNKPIQDPLVPVEGGDEAIEVDEETPKAVKLSFAQFAKQSLTALKLIAIWAVVIAFGLVLFRGADGLVFTSYVIIVVAVGYFRSLGPEKFVLFCAKRAIFLIPGVVALLLLVPPVIPYVHNWIDTDWERAANPPKVFYIWNVDGTLYTDVTLKARLDRWNPNDEKNQAIQAMLLAAAHSVGIKADKLVPYDSSMHKKDEAFTLVVFEVVSATKKPATESEEEGMPGVNEDYGEAKGTQVTRLQLYFISPIIPVPSEAGEEGEEEDVFADEDEKKDKGKDKDEKSKPKFKFVKVYAPENLDIRFDFLTEGFSQSTGREVDLEFIGEFLKAQEAKRDELEGAGEGLGL